MGLVNGPLMLTIVQMILTENSATMSEWYFGINLAIYSFLIEILDSINTKYCNNRRFLLKCTCDANFCTK